MVQAIHSKIINTAAREILTPMGVQQKGQSRLWFDDHGWWVILVEFQPDKWHRGTYLNTGINWLWIDRNYFAYDEVKHAGSFIAFQTEEQFKDETHQMVKRAAEEVRRYRKNYHSIEAVARLLKRKWRKDNWILYHTAVACGLCGQKRQSNKFFNALIKKTCHADWEKFLKQRAMQLMETLQDINEFRECIKEQIINTRNQLPLKSWDNPYF